MSGVLVLFERRELHFGSACETRGAVALRIAAGFWVLILDGPKR